MPLPALSRNKPPAAPDPFTSLCHANAYAIVRGLSKIERRMKDTLSPLQMHKVKGLLKEAGRLQRMCNQLGPEFLDIVDRFKKRVTSEQVNHHSSNRGGVTVVAPLYLPPIKERAMLPQKRSAPLAPLVDLHLMRLTERFGFAAS